MKHKRKCANFLMGIGACLLFASLFLLGRNLKEEKQAKEFTQNIMFQMQEMLPAQQTAPPEQAEEPPQNLHWQGFVIDGCGYLGILSIPSLSLELPVQAEFDMQQLRNTPCCYLGATPDDKLMIAAHNYKWHFGTLQSLTEGQLVTLTDTNGSCVRYTVTAVTQLDGSEGEALCNTDAALTLFTCTYGGKKRIVVRCSREAG